MQVTVLYFAALKDGAGTAQESFELTEGATLDALLREIARCHPGIERWLPHVRVAVNLDYAAADRVLAAGDEVALIPPVSGGSGLFAIRTTELSLDEVVRSVQGQAGHGAGAICTFLGVVRGHARTPDGVLHEDICHLEYEAYAPMAEKEMARIGAEVGERYGAACAITHRTGRLTLGEASVAIAVAAAHRGEALDACRYAIEELKKRVPVWKKETAASGMWWVEGSAG